MDGSKEETRLVHVVVEEYNMHRLLRSVCIFCRSSYIEYELTRIYRGSARASAGSWQHRHASLHSHAALCTSTVTLTPRAHRPSSNKRPVPPWSILRRNVPRGPPQASSSPLGAYSSPAAHRITPHNLTSPPYLPISTYILVEQSPPQNAQRLDWLVDISGHHLWHASLTCAAGDTR
jgi:hypothetical protein